VSSIVADKQHIVPTFSPEAKSIDNMSMNF